MKRQFWNLHFGNRAFIFSLDMIIAIVVVMAILIVSTFYVTKAGGESVSRLETIRIGSDVLALLDYNGTLDTLSIGNIEIELNRILPINYHMRITANCEDVEGGSIVVETTTEVPTDRFIGAGRRVFISDTNKNCIADYKIWLK